VYRRSCFSRRALRCFALPILPPSTCPSLVRLTDLNLPPYRSSFIGTILLMTLTPSTLANRIGMLISYYITLSFWSAQTLSMSMISRNIAGQTKKTTAVAANFIAWAVGNAIGPQVFLGRENPKYYTAFAVHLGCYSILVVTILVLRVWLIRENDRKERLREDGVRDAVHDVGRAHAFEDLTDRENLGFRYAL
jgi:hypothetical protein